jgi:DNA-binding MarR family transcriptional regulator
MGLSRTKAVPAPDQAEDARNTAYLLQAAHRAYVARVADAVRRAGHPELRTVHGGNVFAHLRAEGSRLSELAARAGMADQSMSYLVDYLAQHGYVERVLDPTDARAKLIRRTERGWQAERAGEAAVAQLEAAAARRLGAERLRALRTLLAELAAALEAPTDQEALRQ